MFPRVLFVIFILEPFLKSSGNNCVGCEILMAVAVSRNVLCDIDVSE
jgi:hypothetical protein